MARIDPVPEGTGGPVVRAAYRSSRKRFGHVTEPLAVTAHTPGLLAGYGAFELATEKATRAPAHLKFLGEIRAASLVGCEYCLDIATMLSKKTSVTEAQLRDLHRWRESEHFDDDERLVLELSDAMTRTPVEVSDELIAALRERLGDPALVELVSVLALENYRARFNWAFDIGAEGFADGAFCPSPAAVAEAEAAAAEAAA